MKPNCEYCFYYNSGKFNEIHCYECGQSGFKGFYPDEQKILEYQRKLTNYPCEFVKGIIDDKCLICEFATFKPNETPCNACIYYCCIKQLNTFDHEYEPRECVLEKPIGSDMAAVADMLQNEIKKSVEENNMKRDCNNCKYERKGILDKPCWKCTDENDYFESKEGVKSVDTKLTKIEKILNALNKVDEYFNGQVDIDAKIKLRNHVYNNYGCSTDIKVKLQDKLRNRLELFKTMVIDALDEVSGYDKYCISWKYRAEDSYSYFTSDEAVPNYVNVIEGTFSIN